MRIVFAALVGVVLSVASGFLIVSVKGPVFHWEMADDHDYCLRNLRRIHERTECHYRYSDKINHLTQWHRRHVRRIVLGLVVGWWLSVNSSANNPNAPEGLMFWIAAMMVIGGACRD